MTYAYKSTGKVVLVTVLLGLSGAAMVLASPFAYFADYQQDNGKVWVVDTATNALVTTIPVVRGSWGVAVNPAGTRVYVTSYDVFNNGISVIDTDRNSVVATNVAAIPGSLMAGVAVSPDGSRVYGAHWYTCYDIFTNAYYRGDTVDVIDATTNTVIATVRVGYRPRTIVVSPDGSRVYVANECGDTSVPPGGGICGSCGPKGTHGIDVIDTATNSVVAILPIYTATLAFSPDGQRLYFEKDGAIGVLDVATSSIAATISSPYHCGPIKGIALNPDGTRLYAIQPGCWDGSHWQFGFLAIDTSINGVIAALRLPGIGTNGVSVTPDGNWIYLPYIEGVHVIDATTNTLAATLPVPGMYTFGNFIGPAFTCGNGIREPAEECDDGNSVDGNGCDTDCKRSCGNGTVDSAEQCDDGNRADGDGCDSNCTVTTCGNAIVTVGENCDDGNLIEGDGCSSTCTVESGFTCFGSPSVCEIPPVPSNCHVEWFVKNPNAKVNRRGFAGRQVCTDGDPICDFKADQSGVCEYQVKVCLNNKDRRLPQCTPNGVGSVKVIGPNPDRIQDAGLRAVATANVASVQFGLQHLLDPANPAAGYTNASPLSAVEQGFCSAEFPVHVPLQGARQKSMIIRTRTTDLRAPKPLESTSKLKLACRAAQ